MPICGKCYEKMKQSKGREKETEESAILDMIVSKTFIRRCRLCGSPEECSLGTMFQVEGTVMAKAWRQKLACVRNSRKIFVDRVTG